QQEGAGRRRPRRQGTHGAVRPAPLLALADARDLWPGLQRHPELGPPGRRRPAAAPEGRAQDGRDEEGRAVSPAGGADMTDLAGTTTFSTAAASGIGMGVATALAQAGIKVMMCDIEKDALDAAVAGLKRTNADVAGVVADVSLKSQLQAAADATIERYGE